MRLSEDTYQAWRSAIRTREDGKPGMNQDGVLMPVRALYFDIHCRAAVPPLPKVAPKERGKKRPTPPRRRTKAGNVGQRADGRYRVRAQRESKCEVCQLPVFVGDLVVCDDFGQWVHDGCCPDAAGARRVAPVDVEEAVLAPAVLTGGRIE